MKLSDFVKEVANRGGDVSSLEVEGLSGRGGRTKLVDLDRRGINAIFYGDMRTNINYGSPNGQVDVMRVSLHKFGVLLSVGSKYR